MYKTTESISSAGQWNAKIGGGWNQPTDLVSIVGYYPGDGHYVSSFMFRIPSHSGFYQSNNIEVAISLRYNSEVEGIAAYISPINITNTNEIYANSNYNSPSRKLKDSSIPRSGSWAYNRYGELAGTRNEDYNRGSKLYFKFPSSAFSENTTYSLYFIREPQSGYYGNGRVKFYLDNISFTYTKKDRYYLKVQESLNNELITNITPGWFSVYINSQRVEDQTSSFNKYYYEDDEYLITTINSKDGYIYKGQTSYRGTINKNTTIILPFLQECIVNFYNEDYTQLFNQQKAIYGQTIRLVKADQVSKKSKIEVYTTTFDFNIPEKPLKEEVDTNSITNFTLSGWDGGNQIYPPGEPYTVLSNSLFVSVWKEEIITDFVTFPTVPKRPGYKFLGWFDSNDQEITVYQPTENKTLTAHWKMVSTPVYIYDKNDPKGWSNYIPKIYNGSNWENFQIKFF